MVNSIRVYSYKEGLLAKLAHDLRLTCTRFSIVQKGRSLVGRFDTGSLRVDGAMREGHLDTSQLSGADLQKIHDHIAQDILHTQRHPEARFTGRVAGNEPPFSIRGELTLCGVTQPIALQMRREGSRFRGEVQIVPSHFGIKPFRAMGGALKVQDRVLVEVEVDASVVDRDGVHEALEHTFTPN